MKSPPKVYACTMQDVPQVVVISQGFEHVPFTQLAAFVVAAIAPALDELEGDRHPRRFPRRVNGGMDLLIECDSYADACRLQDRIDRLYPVALVTTLVNATIGAAP